MTASTTHHRLPVDATALLDEMRAFVVLLSNSGHVTFVNTRIPMQDGQSRESVLGCHFSQLAWWSQHPDSATQIQDAIEHAGRGIRKYLDLDVQLGHGPKMVVEFGFRPLTDSGGAVVAILAEGHDVTDQRLVEHKLREAHFRWRSIADFTVDWELWLHPNGHFLYCSPSCERISGVASDEFMQGKASLLSIAHPDDRERVLDVMTRTFSESMGECQRFRIVRRDGSVRWASMSWQSVRDENGRPMGVRVSVRDITEMRGVEFEVEHLLEAYRELARHFPKGLVALFDRDLQILVCEGPAWNKLAIDPASLVGKRIPDLLGTSLLVRAAPLLSAALRGHEVTESFHAGETSWSVRLCPLPNEKGTITRVVATAVESTDATRRTPALASISLDS